MLHTTTVYIQFSATYIALGFAGIT